MAQVSSTFDNRVTFDYVLPQNWVWTSFTNVATIGQGGTPKTEQKAYWGGDIPWLRSGEIKFNRITSSKERITQRGLQSSAAKLLPKGTVLLAMTGQGLTRGRAAILDIAASANQSCAHIILDSRLMINEFMFYYLMKEYRNIRQIEKGSNQPGLNTTIIKGFKIPLPPLPEQRRIISKIEQLFTRLDAASNYLELVKAQLKQYHRSVLKCALEGKLTEEWREAHQGGIEPAAVNLEWLWQQLSKKAKKGTESAPCLSVPQSAGLPESWAYGKLGDWIYIAGRIGWRGLKAQEYTNDGPLFLSAHNLGRGELVDLSHGYHLSEARYEESPEIKLEEDDILLVKDGAGIGRIGIVKRLDREATVNSSLLVIRSRDAFIPKFLFYLLKGPKMQEIVRKRITGSATPHLFQRDIKQLELLIPPLIEQQEIVKEIERRLSNIEDMENVLDKSLKRGRSLRQSILERAYKGKLVQQDPKDEPTSILLEAIKDAKLQKQAKSNSADHQKPLQMELRHYVK